MCVGFCNFMDSRFFFGGGHAWPGHRSTNGSLLHVGGGGGGGIIKSVLASGVPTHPPPSMHVAWPVGLHHRSPLSQGAGLGWNFFEGPLWNKHVFVWHGPLGLCRKSVNMGHLQEAWGFFQKGRGKPGHSSHFVSPPGRGSLRTRRPYMRRRKYLTNAKTIFMGKYRAFVEDTCMYGDCSSSRHACMCGGEV